MDTYTEHVQSLHRQVASSIPIEQFVDCINPAALGLKSKQELFAPIQFDIQVAGGAHGAIRMHVPVHANDSWVSDLKRRMGSTLNIASEQLDLRTVAGVPVAEIPVHQLSRVGKLYVYKNNKPIRMPAIPAVPIEYSVTKVKELKRWISSVCDALPDQIAGLLTNKDIAHVDQCVGKDGAVFKLIKNTLAERAAPHSWTEFVRIHCLNSPERLSTADHVQDQITTVMLKNVRAMIGASSDRIRNHVAERQFKSTGSDLYKPLLSNTISTAENSHELYRELAEQAVSMSALHERMLNTVYHFSAPLVSVATKTTPTIKTESSLHPWHAQIHGVLLPLCGAYPTDYLLRHTKHDMSIHAKYAGDPYRTLEAYHAFSQAPPCPAGIRISSFERIEAKKPGFWKRRKQKKKEKKLMKKTSIVKGEMPPLVPIGCHGKPSTNGDDDDNMNMEIQGKLPDLIPIGDSAVQRKLPDLIPIGDSVLSRKLPDLIPIGDSTVQRKLLDLIPIGDSTVQRKLPDLIPIGDGAVQRKLPDLIPIGDSAGQRKLPDLIPIGNSAIQRKLPVLVPIGDRDDFPDLPQVADLFK